MTTSLALKRLARRGALGAALSVAVVLGTVAPAIAGQHSTTTTVANAKGADPTNYRAQMKLWEGQRQAIALTFRSAVASARRAFDVAKSQSVTSADRYAARTQFEAAIALAAENRSSQLIALGAPPSPGTGTGSNSHKASQSRNETGRQSDFLRLRETF